jgi:3'-phosphoadenosine 5'-phosphosulfate sulfotransferase (PAPS reductase)/FAD synthetase
MRPEMSFVEVIKKYGYPVISKEVSKYIKEGRTALQKGNMNYYAIQKLQGRLKDKNGNKSIYNCEKWEFMLDAPYKISNYCCDVMKKKPANLYEKETGRKPIIGTLASESKLRKQQWIVNGCNAFGKNRPSSQPLSFWTEQDILHYIKKYDIPYCSVYGDIVIDSNNEFSEQMSIIDFLGEYGPADKLKTTGCNRTGCIFCMFGCQLEKEPNRFQKLKITHPRQYEYCIGGGEFVDGMLQPNKEGLGLGKVLDYIGVKY